METAVLLHNVRSTHNVGSIFRTADAAGVSRIYVSGYTPAPTDRFGRKRNDIAKAALGAEAFVPWEEVRRPSALIERLRGEGWYVVAVEQEARAIDYRKLRPRKRTLFILGNEVRGLPKRLLDTCDAIIEIPMRGKKESLNVSVAAGVILFHSL